MEAGPHHSPSAIVLFTIGFSGKSAEQFCAIKLSPR